MGMATVALIYDLVRRRFGRVGGFVAGLTLAITPITVAMSRHNNPDAAVILCCVAALWFAVRAFEDGRTKWIVWSGVDGRARVRGEDGRRPCWSCPGSPRPGCGHRRSGRSGASASCWRVAPRWSSVGGAWPLLVALTPAADRPWIAGTADNSIWSLITGYNGVGRISGQSGGPARRRWLRRRLARPSAAARACCAC